MADLDLGVVTNGASVDVVTERVEADVIYADVILELSRLNTLNLFNVDTADRAPVVPRSPTSWSAPSIRFAPTARRSPPDRRRRYVRPGQHHGVDGVPPP